MVCCVWILRTWNSQWICVWQWTPNHIIHIWESNEVDVYCECVPRRFKMVLSFLFFHTWILFCIVFNLMFCFVQQKCHFWYRIFWVSFFFKSIKVLTSKIRVSVDEAAIGALWSAYSPPSIQQCPGIYRKDITIPFWHALILFFNWF